MMKWIHLLIQASIFLAATQPVAMTGGQEPTEPTPQEGATAEPAETDEAPSAPQGDAGAPVEDETPATPATEGEEKPPTGEAEPSTGEAKPPTGEAEPPTGEAEPAPPIDVEPETPPPAEPSAPGEPDPFKDEPFMPEEQPEPEPFSKGDMEAGLGLGAAGVGDYFHLTLRGFFAYYIFDRLAPGLDLGYTHMFGDDTVSRGRYKIKIDLPDSLLLMPFVKYVFFQSGSFFPYVVVSGGRQFEWGADEAASGWTVGGGLGAHVRVAGRVQFRIQLLALHYWYDSRKVMGYADEKIYTDGEGYEFYAEPAYLSPPETVGEGIILTDKNGNRFKCMGETYEDLEMNCPLVEDEADTKKKWFFPLISIGLAVVF